MYQPYDVQRSELRTLSYKVFVLFSVAAFSWTFAAQRSSSSPSADAPPESSNVAASGYVLGPDDQLTIRGVDAEEITDKPASVDTSGFVSLPLVGRIKAAGLTTEEFERELNRRLMRYFHTPQAAVSVSEFRSQPVSVIGAVNTPGVHQVHGRKTLIEIIAIAGGLRPDAGSSIKISRPLAQGRIPLPSAKDDDTGQFSVAHVSMNVILQATHPEENILVQPHDVISVPRADLVYVVGAVEKPGGFTLNERETISVLQALSLAGGLGQTPAAKETKIFRMDKRAGHRTEVHVDLPRILGGKAPDMPLQSDDVLFVPVSTGKRAALRSMEAVIQTASGLVIWRR